VRSEIAALAAILVVGLLMRLAFDLRSPPFVTNDSLSYLLPGYDLIHGAGFMPLLKRPPLYPLFVGSVFAGFGEELRVLTLVQHLLGVLTVLLACGIGRLLFGPAAGLLAALLTALSGPLIVTEHYLMSETLFGLLLMAGLFAYLLGVRPRASSPACPTPAAGRQPASSGHEGNVTAENAGSPPPSPAPQAGVGSGVRWLALAGLLLGLATLTRPIAQLVVIMLALALPYLTPRWRPVLIGAVALVGLFVVTILPWMVRNEVVQGTFAVAGGSGEGLAVRTIRYGQQFDFREPSGGDPDRLTQRARRIYRDEAGDGSAFELAARLRDELHISEIEAERLMRSIALQAILRAPSYYLRGTADMFVQTFVGRPVRLRQDWTPWRNIDWDDRVEHLLPGPTPAEDRSFAAAERLATLYDPARFGLPIAVLGLLGLALAPSGTRRQVWLLGGLVLAVLLAGAALIGIEWRYRFPLDPAINVLVAGGVVGLVKLAQSTVRHLAPANHAGSQPTPASLP
jgi:4-amino-4-deoxy-L-arabinose transferase-like glycosyltransferase